MNMPKRIEEKFKLMKKAAKKTFQSHVKLLPCKGCGAVPNPIIESLTGYEIKCSECRVSTGVMPTVMLLVEKWNGIMEQKEIA